MHPNVFHHSKSSSSSSGASGVNPLSSLSSASGNGFSPVEHVRICRTVSVSVTCLQPDGSQLLFLFFLTIPQPNFKAARVSIFSFALDVTGFKSSCGPRKWLIQYHHHSIPHFLGYIYILYMELDRYQF